MALKVLHIAPLDGNRGSGLNQAIPSLVRAQQAQGASVSVIGTGSKDGLRLVEDLEARLWSDLSKAAAEDRIGGADIAVFHSTYIPAHAKIAKALRGASVPYIITPASGMTLAAARIKPWKKRLGNLLFFNRLVREATALHFLSKGEAQASAHWNKRSFVVGNGVDPAPASFARNVDPHEPVKFVFIGRLSIEQKGLDLLIEAWAAFKKELPDARASLHLYGPDHEGGKRWLESVIARLHVGDSVRIEGPVYGKEKEVTLSEASVFVHTSRFEGCPMAVLEALARGVPCLLTPGTFMADDVAATGAGLAVGADPQVISQALSAIVSGDYDFNAMRAAALDWANRNTWARVADETLSAYSRVIQGG